MNTRLKSKKSTELEALAKSGFLAAEIPRPAAGWQDMVLADIRTLKTTDGRDREKTFQLLLPLQLTWRFAAVAVILAATFCFSFYLTGPANSNDEYLSEVSVDCYDNYIQIADRL
ncbi:MAG: hypothetical protein PHV59_05245 [Victivallales bacterium]|nr:hypothetical protein [Victivallales bacterium]